MIQVYAVLGALFASWMVYKMYGGEAHRCLFCGTRSGEHGKTCPWK